MERATIADVEIAALQIGRRPRSVAGIAHRCSYGFPHVLAVAPLMEGSPFPTLFWLSCPYLVRRISFLEAAGWIGRLQEALAADPALRRRFAEAHRLYIDERARLLSDLDRAEIGRRGWGDALARRGIGGTARMDRIKCLHLHAAHAMVRFNPVGEAVLRAAGTSECPPARVICSALTQGGADLCLRINR